MRIYKIVTSGKSTEIKHKSLTLEIVDSCLIFKVKDKVIAAFSCWSECYLMDDGNNEWKWKK